MSDTPKRFEDWEQVDCNECARYWDSSCDGVQGSTRPCNSFLATRSVVIPAKIKDLEEAVRSLKWQVFLCALLLLFLGVCIGGLHYGG